ncbi:MAG: hypothetical protein QM778_21670 [Myxococcales bacterium]
MAGPPPIPYAGRYYTLLQARAAAPQAGLGRALTSHEAESMLARMMRDDLARARLRGDYARMTGSPGITQVKNDAILDWFTKQLQRPHAGGSLVMLVRGAGAAGPAQSAKASNEPHELREARRVDDLVRELGNHDMMFSGSGYRVVRAPNNGQLEQRSSLEVLGEREAKQVLSALASDPRRPERQKQALVKLDELFEQLRGKPALELLVLRRYRMYVRPQEQAAVTPSQMRAKAKKNVTLWLVDEWGNPKGDLAYKFYSPSGVEPGSFPPSGEKKHEGLDPGTVQVGLGVHPDDWFERAAPPVGYLAEELEISLLDELGMPLANRSFTAKFQNGVSMGGTTDASGYAILTGTPSYPVTVVFDNFDIEDWA